MEKYIPFIGLALTLVGIVVAITNVWGVFVINRVLSKADAIEKTVGEHSSVLAVGSERLREIDRWRDTHGEEHGAIWGRLDNHDERLRKVGG